MSSQLSRRNVLIASGMALAAPGCTGIGSSDDGFTDGRNPADDTGSLEIRPPAIDEGDLVDDFEDLSMWSYGVGDFDGDDADPRLGTQAMHLTSSDTSDRVEAYRSFDKPLDLSDRHLSLAVKVETDGAARIRFDLFAPDSSNVLRIDRTIARDLNDWIRIDLGYTNQSGTPDPAAIEELRLRVESRDGEPIDCWVDDLRATPAAESPRAVLVLNNARSAYYDRIYPILESRGYAAVVPVWRAGIEGSGRLDADELRTLRDAGWDIASRPTGDQPLPELDADEQRSVIERNRDYLEGRGFGDGWRHCVPPGYRMGSDTLEVIRDVHDTGVTFGGCPNANPPVTRHTTSLFNGDAGESTHRLIDLAGEFNQSVILGFSRITEDGDFTDDDFESLLDDLEERDFEIVTLSELFE